jgi:glutaredoxin 3
MKKWFFLLCIIVTHFNLRAEGAPPESELVQRQERPRLVLYYSPSCPYSQKVLNYLKSINKTVPMKNVHASPQIKEELITKGGKGQVPCLFINDKPLYESDLIVQWLSANKTMY